MAARLNPARAGRRWCERQELSTSVSEDRDRGPRVDTSQSIKTTNQTKTKHERRNKIMRKSLPILLTAIRIASIGLSSSAAEPSAPSGLVNINTADVAQLS